MKEAAYIFAKFASRVVFDALPHFRWLRLRLPQHLLIEGEDIALQSRMGHSLSSHSDAGSLQSNQLRRIRFERGLQKTRERYLCDGLVHEEPSRFDKSTAVPLLVCYVNRDIILFFLT